MQPTLLLDHELAVTQSGYVVRALLTLAGQAPDDGAPPLALSIVLDRSGSMAGEKLAAARDAAATLVRRLRVQDVVSVVAYDDEVTTVAPPATGAAQASLPNDLLAIEPRGSTNLSGGWLRGHELLADWRRDHAPVEGADGGAGADGAMHRIVLLTDGQANVGITAPERLVGLCRVARAAGITTTTIGFGEGYDETLLRAMADAGGGNAYYIERPDQAAGVFAAELAGLHALCAQNVSVEVRPGAATELVAVHHRYPSVADDDGVRLEIGDVYAREPRALLCEFFVPGLAERPEVLVAEIVVRAVVLTAGGGVERQEVRVPVSSPLTAAGRREPTVRREMLLVEAARAREAAVEASARGDYAAGREALASVSAMLCAAPLDERDAGVGEEAADLAAMASLFEEGQVSAADVKYLGQRAYEAQRKKRGGVRRGPA